MKRTILTMMLLCVFACEWLVAPANAHEGGIPVGGIHILKSSVTGEPLDGAVFQIARELRDGELTNQKVEKIILRIADENRIMALESFWTTREMTGEKQKEVATDKNGGAAIFGLPFGTYYLVESVAPEGYNRITDAIRITIHKYSHLTQEDNVCDDKGVLIDNTLHIVNVRYALPETGNLAEVQLAAAGTGILFSSAALILLNRNKWH